MASLDAHAFSCSDETDLNFNKTILETAKETVTFKCGKKHHYERKRKAPGWS